MAKSLFSSKIAYIIFGLYALLLGWWIVIFVSGTKEGTENYIFGFAYALIALVGGINGLFISKKWGGLKSMVGKGIVFFSLGLIGLWWGQSVWSYYNVILQVEVPYPSLADIGFFSVIPFYTAGIYHLFRASGAKFSLKKIDGKLSLIFLPLIAVGIAYFTFVQNLAPDFSDPLKTFLDFGYPLGEAIPISLAITTYFLSKGLLGGKMKGKILFLIIALIIHIITEYTFIYTAAEGTYYNSGPVDLMYMTSFAVTAIALIAFKDYN